MHHNIPQIVSLDPSEKKLLDQITFDFDRHNDEILRASCKAADTLANLLLMREAIPEIRIRFFIEPEFNIGAKKSRLQVFESDGVTGYAIFGDPRFLEYLRYFIYGPDLPDQVKTEFCNMEYPYEYISGGEIGDLRKLAISLVREYNLIPSEAACEFFKLAIECGMDAYSAQLIRDAVREVK
ncbi:MAG: hypothetical protein V3T88_05885 [Nitrosomonadaceae bacterium]